MSNLRKPSVVLNYAIFMVADEPICLWSTEDIIPQNLHFLDDIDPAFFMYQAQSNLKLFNYKKYKRHAAVAIRIAFSHGLETLFSLLGAFIQAPY